MAPGENMTQLKKVVEPFGEVNVHPPQAARSRVTATILMEPHKEGAQTGVALDGSGSMAPLYGVGGEEPGFLASLFGAKKEVHNEVTPVAQKVCSYLAARSTPTAAPPASTGPSARTAASIEVVGDLTADQAERHIFGPPREFGTGTQLLPAVKYFVERFTRCAMGHLCLHHRRRTARSGAGESIQHPAARAVQAKQRNPLKFVLIGVGHEINEQQMEELDDLDTGTEVDLWDHKIAAEMRLLQEIFAEVVDKNARVSDHGRILDPAGRTVKDYSDTGVPAFLEFDMPAGADYFTLDVNGSKIHQGLSDHAHVPPSELAR